MFEVIVQSQPEDTQSLEILKEAYSKLSKEKEVVHTSKRIAQAYVQLGQLSSAILEYESILQKFPDDPDVQNALAEIESKASNIGGGPMVVEPEPVPQAQTVKGKTADAKSGMGDFDDGRNAMQKLFVDAKFITINDFELYWPKPNPHDSPTQVVEPFVQVLQDKGVATAEKSIKFLADRTRMGYIPIDRYDVDVELARSFPRDTCLRWCVLPFDRMSKAVLVATANPFNKMAMREIEAATKNRIIWYLSPPLELVKALKKVFR